MQRYMLAAAVGLLLGAILLGGRDVLGRFAMTLGAPRIAASLFVAPDWRGAALFRAGLYRDAVAQLTAAGPEAAYNLGNAQVRLGSYAAALEAYDFAMAYRSDAQALANFDLVSAFYAGARIDPDNIARWGEDKEGATAKAEVARGDARGSGSGDDVTNTGATIGLPALQSREQRSVRKVFNDQFVIASPRWLATLQDVPGEYLAARIAHEHKRRRQAGVGQPPLEEDW